MAHGITENDTMFSVKKRPWHGLGTIVNEAPSIDEGIKLAGLDWLVEKEPIWTESGVKCPSNFAISRELPGGEKIVLGVVGEQYQPLQNIESFKWFNPFIESGLVELETAGSLFQGKKIFILAKIKAENLVVSDGDEIERFVLLSNSHDGTTAVRVGYTPVRVVCNNTLTLAHSSQGSKLIRVRHTNQVQNNLVEIRETMDLVNQQFLATVEKFRYLAKRDIVKSDLERYVNQVFSIQKLEESLSEEEMPERKSRLLGRIEELFESGRGSKLAGKTMWGAYNAVQEYLQYERGHSWTNEEKRYNSLWFGDSANINRKALEIALQN